MNGYYFLVCLTDLSYFKKPRYAQSALLNLTSTKASFFQQISFEVKDAVFYYNRGYTYRNLKQNERAIQDFDQAIALDPKDKDAFINRGYTYCNLKQYERAIQDFDQAIALDPKDKDAFINRGRAYVGLKQYERAKIDFSHSYKLDDTNTNGVWMAEWVGFYKMENIPVLVERLTDLAKGAGEEYNYSGLVCQGVALLLQKEYDEALARLEKALIIHPIAPGYWDAPFWLAMVQGYRGKFEEALAMLDKALEADLPEGLLFPLKWLEEAQLEFFQERLQPWLEQHQLEI